MGEKVYKPIVKDGDHLIRSKDNPDRVRGLTRDENNQNPDIIEWEEYDVDDLRSDDYDPYPYEERRVQLTPEQEEVAQQVGEALGAAIVAGGILLFREVISPWWKNTAWPWVKEKGRGIKNAVSGKRSKRPQQQQKQLLKNKLSQIDGLQMFLRRLIRRLNNFTSRWMKRKPKPI